MNRAPALALGACLAAAAPTAGRQARQDASGIAREHRVHVSAYDLRDQLVVTYLRPAASRPPARLDVSVSRRGVRLRAPKQVPGR